MHERGIQILYTPPYLLWMQPCEFFFGIFENGVKDGRLSLDHPDGPKAAIKSVFRLVAPDKATARRFLCHAGLTEPMDW
ncbi:hypothetical protein Rhopal_002992-T1 [Rhodotorula paludigena]|uniref:Transposase n=1 Tax=Rhodotorula paludigena TaxID=86838 RepID=A0AAV5GJD8_9BASI|nr:hypothetical protein Rhopal_002992-T1 [Rhodotorula paludigena]